MFQMKDVGRKIAQKRKEKNMTQMELADIMGVSFQAVSNWERGNSMPDISKLPELAEWLDVSIDELLTDEKPAKLVQHILKGEEEAYIREENIGAETVAEVAPILKPQQTETILETVLNNNPDQVELIDLVSIAPFVSSDFLSEWALKVTSIDNIKQLANLAPFLPDETLEHMVDKLTDAEVSISSLIPLAPFLSENALNKLASSALSDVSLDGLIPLAPFLSDNALDSIVAQLGEKPETSMRSLRALAPFLSDKTLNRLADGALDSANPEDLTALAPFLPSGTLKKCAEKLIAKYGIAGIKGIAPFL